MTDQSPNDQQGNRRDRPGQETRISNVPYGERFKRAKRGGFGGNKTVLVLGIIAMFLFVVVVAISIKKLTQKSGKDAISSTASEMKTGKLSTIPEGYRSTPVIHCWERRRSLSLPKKGAC